jgi:metal-responsive CopG/Arc/MetJ family transcriptional regulator
MATKKRVNITIDSETLRLADRTARRQKVSRSQLIRTAIRDAAVAQDRQFEAEARRKRQQQASETMDRLAQKAGTWPAVQILHQWRYRLERER